MVAAIHVVQNRERRAFKMTTSCLAQAGWNVEAVLKSDLRSSSSPQASCRRFPNPPAYHCRPASSIDKQANISF